MRLRKRVVLIDANETGREIRAFVLRVWGYTVEAFESARASRCELYGVVTAIAVYPTIADVKALRQLRKRSEDLRILTLEPQFKMVNPSVLADIRLLESRPTAELRESLRVLTARKRGPKKGEKLEKKSVQPASLAMRPERVVNCNAALGL